MSIDLPLEDKIDLMQALNELIRNKRDAIQTMIWITLRWKPTPQEIAGEYARLKIKAKDRLIIFGKN